MNSFKETTQADIQSIHSTLTDSPISGSASLYNATAATDTPYTGGESKPKTLTDLVCISHLRWNFVYQRPQHLISRFAKKGRVVFFEEPIWEAIGIEPHFDIQDREDGRLTLIVPHLPGGRTEEEDKAEQARYLRGYLAQNGYKDYILWMYTPMGLPVADGLEPAVTVFDCMDELSAFKGADPRLLEFETKLMAKSDLVFTGGLSIYEAKRHKHPRVHAFPSSIDRAHFAQALQDLPDPEDQAGIPHPRVGFYGVVDERFDIELLNAVSGKMPDVHFVIIGPVVKIDPETLPRRANIHYLGGKHYNELPHYLRHWDVAMLPFALNESTRFISPTKTPEYLAAGKPVVSTPIRDVVNPYGEKGLVEIALTPVAFAEAVRRALTNPEDKEWRQSVDTFLAGLSWDQTFQDMHDRIHQVYHQSK